MEHAVLGLADEASDLAATEWMIERAQSRPVHVTLVAAHDIGASNPDADRHMLATASGRIQQAAPGTPVDTMVTDRPLLHELLEQSESTDLIVIGCHPDPALRQSRTPSLPVSLAARSRCAVVIVPEDRVAHVGPIVVGIETGGDSRDALMFAAREAEATGRDLDVVHTWEPWAIARTRSGQFEHEGILEAAVADIRAAFPGVRVRGVLVEAVAHDGIIANSRNAHLIVLGTYGLGRETGLVLGTIHQEVMMRGGVALCIVPLVAASDGSA